MFFLGRHTPPGGDSLFDTQLATCLAKIWAMDWMTRFRNAFQRVFKIIRGMGSLGQDLLDDLLEGPWRPRRRLLPRP